MAGGRCGRRFHARALRRRRNITGSGVGQDFSRTQDVSRASEPPAGFRIYAVDVSAGQAGFYGVMKERGVDSLPLGGSSSNLQAGEIFKIERGRIVGVEAMGASLPYGTKSGWGD